MDRIKSDLKEMIRNIIRKEISLEIRKEIKRGIQETVREIIGQDSRERAIEIQEDLLRMSHDENEVEEWDFQKNLNNDD